MHGLRSIALAPAALALAAGAAAALAASSYPDPVGDVKGGAGPDIAAVSVSHTARTVTFRVRFAKAPPLGASARQRWVDMLLIGIDVPPRGPLPTRRDWQGVDYAVGLHGGQRTALLVRAPGWTTVARVPVAVQGRTLSVSVGRRTIGSPAAFDFVVSAGRELADGAGGGSDSAPPRGVFHYRLAG